MTAPLRPYSSKEHLADGCVHGIGITASLIGTGALMLMASWTLPAYDIVPVAVYLITMVTLFMASASYHMLPQPHLRDIFRRIDQAAIYFKIAGTYTPIALLKLSGVIGYSLLGGVWAIAVVGAVAKLLWPDHLIKTSYALYMCAGWAGLVVLQELLEKLPSSALTLLLIGGVIYTIGIIFHLWERLPFHQALWHTSVLAASCCHFAAIVLVIGSEIV